MRSLIAVLVALSFTACFIGILHYSSFERHHTHDWPQEHGYSDQGTTNRNKPASPDNQKLQHDDHKAQIIMAGLTGIGILVALGGLILIWRTLVHTGHAATAAMETLAEAKKAANEASRANEISAKSVNTAMLALQESRDRTRIELEPGIVVKEVVSIDFHMATEVEVQGTTVTQLDIIAMEQQDGRFWHAGLWCKVNLRVQNWGKLPIYDIDVSGNISISSAHHDQPHQNEKPGTMRGARHDFIAPDSDEIISIPFCYASFYSDRVRSTNNDPFSGTTRLILDDSFIFIAGTILYRNQFTGSGEKRAINFHWAAMYNPKYDGNNITRQVKMGMPRVVKAAGLNTDD